MLSPLAERSSIGIEQLILISWRDEGSSPSVPMILVAISISLSVESPDLKGWGSFWHVKESEVSPNDRKTEDFCR